MDQGFQTYVVTYRHEGAEWHLDLPATSLEDARRRLSQLALARVDGVGFAKIPATLGPLAKAVVFARNALARFAG